jgi:anti-sigma factor RsiW
MQHPEPALLVAYLDGTLFHRDQAAVDEHLKACIDCVALVAAMRQKRDAEQAARQSRSRITNGAAIVLVAVLGYGVWTVLPWSRRDRPEETAPRVTTSAAPSAPAPATPSAVAMTKPPSAPTPKALPRAIPIEPSTPPAPRVLRRTRDVMVESSTDGGTTWVTEHTADRPIRASAFVDADVA